MTKKKKSILSDQRFIVLLVIIALSAVFSFMSTNSPCLKMNGSF